MLRRCETGKIYRVPLGREGFQLGLGFLCGGLSSLLGIGSGAIMVPALNVAMRIPLNLAAGTSSYVTGVFAASGAALLHQNIRWPYVVMMSLGVVLGNKLSQKYLRKLGHRSISYGLAAFY